MVAIYTLAIILLFYILSYAADTVVEKIKEIAEKFNISVLSLGMVLGVLTTMPEFFIGINAIANDMPEIYFGNLMGGVIVIFCLVLGISILLNRKILTDGKYSSIVPVSIYLLLPPLLGLKGYLDFKDGFLFILIYLYFLYKNRGEKKIINKEENRSMAKLGGNFSWIIGGTAIMILSSNGIIKLSTELLSSYNISPFVTGLILFSVGTNLPEIVVSFRAWLKNVPEVSLSHLTGAAIAHIFVIGIFTTMSPLSLVIDDSYKFFLISLIVVLFFIIKYYKSGKAFTKNEGINLLLLYLLFIIGQIIFMGA